MCASDVSATNVLPVNVLALIKKRERMLDHIPTRLLTAIIKSRGPVVDIWHQK